MNLFAGRTLEHAQAECARHYGHNYSVQVAGYDGPDEWYGYICKYCGHYDGPAEDYNDDY